MTTLYVLGSGSRGNCIAVESEGTAVLVDAGFSPREIERRADAAGLALERVEAIVLTHEHGDHARGAARLARRLGTP
nr:MBL fold metallo-hydrolase [Gemmatimonadales bacterium]